QLDAAFGQEQVRVTPRNHYHVIRAHVLTTVGRSEDLVLRDPTHDLNKREDRESFLKEWIESTRASFATTGGKPATVLLHPSSVNAA
ncbi:MAG TPA: hypothetical protein VMM92_12535, partial [Thermoanaerobaculia bacterium]|nr:hypothetical protein [Thermoanaerobaculia bacterium]